MKLVAYKIYFLNFLFFLVLLQWSCTVPEETEQTPHRKPGEGVVINTHPPTTPSLLAPSDKEVEVRLNVVFTWAPSTDVDEEGSVRYDIYLGTDNPPVKRVASYMKDTTYESYIPLSQMTTYFWQVVADDTYKGTTRSPVWSFTTHSVDLPHSPLPSDKSIQSTLDITLSWAPPTKSPGYDMKYDVYLGTSPLLDELISKEQLEDSIQVTNLSIDVQYYWQVIAKFGNVAATVGPVWTFTTRGLIAPRLHLPTDKTVSLPTTGLTLSWKPFIGVDGKNITYDVYVGEDKSLANTLQTNITDTFYTLTTPLNRETTYYWKVVAKDGSANHLESSVWEFKTSALATKESLMQQIR